MAGEQVCCATCVSHRLWAKARYLHFLEKNLWFTCVVHRLAVGSFSLDQPTNTESYLDPNLKTLRPADQLIVSRRLDQIKVGIHHPWKLVVDCHVCGFAADEHSDMELIGFELSGFPTRRSVATKAGLWCSSTTSSFWWNSKSWPISGEVSGWLFDSVCMDDCFLTK